MKSIKPKSEKCPECGEDITLSQTIEKTLDLDPPSICPYCGYILERVK